MAVSLLTLTAIADDVNSAVFDLGSHEVRAGYSGEDTPRSVLPACVGRLPALQTDGDAEMAADKLFSGSSDLNFKRDRMEISPLYSDDSTVMNFDVLEELLSKSLTKNLMLNPKDTPLLFAENSIHQKDLRLKLTEFLFEQMQVPAVFLCKDSVLSAFGCGRSTALVLDCGNTKTVATPVHEGYSLQKCIVAHNIGGQTITDLLQQWLEQESKAPIKPRFSFKKTIKQPEGPDFFTVTPVENPLVHQSYYKYCQNNIVNDLKEQILYVSEEPTQTSTQQDVQRFATNIRTKDFELPDGTQVTIGPQRVKFTEAMFTASLPNDAGFTGIQTMVTESVSRTDIDIRRDLFSSIVLAGGNAMWKNMSDRLNKQIPEIAPQNVKVRVVHSADIKTSAWVGGSILSSLGSFQQMWMSRQEYQEHGAIMIERKCP